MLEVLKVLTSIFFTKQIFQEYPFRGSVFLAPAHVGNDSLWMSVLGVQSPLLLPKHCLNLRRCQRHQITFIGFHYLYELFSHLLDHHHNQLQIQPLLPQTSLFIHFNLLQECFYFQVHQALFLILRGHLRLYFS